MPWWRAPDSCTALVIVLIYGHTKSTTGLADSYRVIDIGPGAGDQGGKVVASGTPQHVAQSKTSRTAPFIARELGLGN